MAFLVTWNKYDDDDDLIWLPCATDTGLTRNYQIWQCDWATAAEDFVEFTAPTREEGAFFSHPVFTQCQMHGRHHHQHPHQSQIYFARASFVIKNAIGGATWEWGANCPCDGGSSMSSSETWNTEVCCTVVTLVVFYSKFVVQPQKCDGDQMKCQCEEPPAGPSWNNAEIEVVHTALIYMFFR